jgi:two-component system invasion response regulator UvrY
MAFCYTEILFTLLSQDKPTITVFYRYFYTPYLAYFLNHACDRSINLHFSKSLLMKKISIMIVDDHALIRETCGNLLNTQENFEVIVATGDSTHIIDIAREKRPDIILLDINMSPVNGFDMIKLFRKNSPLTNIIGLSMHSQPAYAKKMIKLGAKGYLTKNSSSAELIEAIMQVSQGNTYVCSEVKNILSEQVLGDEPDKVDINMLSGRELEILKLLKNGKSSKEIAADLNISSRTVEVHRHHILKKLNLKNTVSVISYFHSFEF